MACDAVAYQYWCEGRGEGAAAHPIRVPGADDASAAAARGAPRG